MFGRPTCLWTWASAANHERCQRAYLLYMEQVSKKRRVTRFKNVCSPTRFANPRAALKSERLIRSILSSAALVAPAPSGNTPTPHLALQLLVLVRHSAHLLFVRKAMPSATIPPWLLSGMSPEACKGNPCALFGYYVHVKYPRRFSPCCLPRRIRGCDRVGGSGVAHVLLVSKQG